MSFRVVNSALMRKRLFPSLSPFPNFIRVPPPLPPHRRGVWFYLAAKDAHPYYHVIGHVWRKMGHFVSHAEICTAYLKKSTRLNIFIFAVVTSVEDHRSCYRSLKGRNV